MKKSQRNLNTNHLSFLELSIYITFYISRIALFMIIRSLSISIIKRLKNISPIVNDILLICLFALFQLYFTINNLLINNVYGGCVSAIIMFHNFIITILTILLVQSQVRVNYIYIPYIVAFSYIFEMFFAIFFILKKRTDNNRTLFQKIGANPVINKSYETRIQLQTIGALNLFIPIGTVGMVFLPPSFKKAELKFTDIIIIGITAIQNIVVYTNFYKEIKVQRKIAIGITVIKLIYIIEEFIFVLLEYRKRSFSIGNLRLVLYIDMIVITLIFLYLLIKDYKDFGKGLKKHIEFKTMSLKL